MLAPAVYILCAITAALICGLLLRGYRRTSVRLLLWSGLCFGAFALDNLFLFTDLIIVPNADLTLLRTPIALIGGILLLYGLIWEKR